ncbi:hypothetical protein KIN20_013405 [Parelaphostrongylus tenuis]|uniref:Uncharacterized protein n=1 Tax=Parelaphostrongylus tenuis TaxID=148309 RepID=A0AAD5MXC9_PARTN|nr:hypothetical protein KIN20_013405 [Parelaphostrongylus tenuis]
MEVGEEYLLAGDDSVAEGRLKSGMQSSKLQRTIWSNSRARAPNLALSFINILPYATCVHEYHVQE